MRIYWRNLLSVFQLGGVARARRLFVRKPYRGVGCILAVFAALTRARKKAGREGEGGRRKGVGIANSAVVG